MTLLNLPYYKILLFKDYDDLLIYLKAESSISHSLKAIIVAVDYFKMHNGGKKIKYSIVILYLRKWEIVTIKI